MHGLTCRNHIRFQDNLLTFLTVTVGKRMCYNVGMTLYLNQAASFGSIHERKYKSNNNLNENDIINKSMKSNMFSIHSTYEE